LTRNDNVDVASAIVLFYDGVFGVPRRVIEVKNHERGEIEPTSGTAFATYGVDDLYAVIPHGSVSQIPAERPMGADSIKISLEGII